MSLNRLASTVFATGPQDSLATIDVYSKKNATIVNSIQDISKKYDTDLASVLRGGDWLSNSMPVIANVAQGLITINKDNLISRIGSLSNSINSAFKSLPNDLKDSVLGAAGDGTGKALVTLAGVATAVSRTNFTNLQSVGQLINGIAGNSNLIKIDDKDSFAGLLVGTIKEATRYGIPNSVGAILSTVGDSDTLSRVIAGIMPDVIRTSDVRSLFSLADSANKHMVPLINRYLVDDFSKNYRSGFGYAPNELLVEYQMMMDAFKNLDGLWDIKMRYFDDDTSEEVLDLTRVLAASSDFQEVMKASLKVSADPRDKFFALASIFQQTNVYQEVKNLLPLSVLTVNNKSVSEIRPPDFI